MAGLSGQMTDSPSDKLTEKLKGKTALVTGASSGLGDDFAHQLAAAGCNLILVARRKERLEAVRDEISATHNVTIDLITMDLLTKDAARSLYDEVKSWDRQVDVLINNAGYGLFGWFFKLDWQKQMDMLQLDMIVPTELTRLFAADMVERGFGYVLFVSSVAGCVATPSYAAYAGAKSYALLLGEALNFELRRTGVGVTVLSPGITRTEFLEVSGQRPTLYQRLFAMASPRVARVGLKAMLARRASVIPGFWNSLLIMSTRIMPRRWQKWVAYGLMWNRQLRQ